MSLKWKKIRFKEQIGIGAVESLWKQLIGCFHIWRTNAEVSRRRKRRKMAAHRCSYTAVLLSFCGLSLFIVAGGQKTTLPVGEHAAANGNPQTGTETAEQTTEPPAVEEELWEATEVEGATPDDAATDTPDTSTQESVVLSPVAQPKDDFQEELVIRPLPSGDIYASFQFRTLWETDFRGNKGMLTVSKHAMSVSHLESKGELIFLMVVECIWILIQEMEIISIYV